MPFDSSAKKSCDSSGSNRNDDNTNSLDVRIWGPDAWNFMHAVTFAYPDQPCAQDKANAIAFFEFVGKSLPCTKCRHHFGKMLSEKPPDVDSRATLSRWLVDRHNEVNVRLKKPTLSYDFVQQKYKDMRSMCPKSSPSSSSEFSFSGSKGDNNSKSTIMALVIALIVVIGLFLVLLGCYWWTRNN